MILLTFSVCSALIFLFASELFFEAWLSILPLRVGEAQARILCLVMHGVRIHVLWYGALPIFLYY